MDATTTIFYRTLERSGLQVSALGLGYWAIGGPFYDAQGKPIGWGEMDDNESIRAIHCAMDWGVNFFDIADAYETGHSEEGFGGGPKRPAGPGHDRDQVWERPRYRESDAGRYGCAPGQMNEIDLLLGK